MSEKDGKRNRRRVVAVMNTRGVYLSTLYRPVVLINLCLNFVLHSADLLSEREREGES